MSSVEVFGLSGLGSAIFYGAMLIAFAFWGVAIGLILIADAIRKHGNRQ